ENDFPVAPVERPLAMRIALVLHHLEQRHWPEGGEKAQALPAVEARHSLHDFLKGLAAGPQGRANVQRLKRSVHVLILHEWDGKKKGAPGVWGTARGRPAGQAPAWRPDRACARAITQARQAPSR